MREALVIAITRMGDLVQSEPFCRALKRRGVDRVVLLVEEAFVPVAKLLLGADEVVALQFRDILPQLGQTPRNYPVAALNQLIQALRKREFCEVWNLTHTRPSMMLCTAIGGDRARGVAMDSRGSQIVRENWLKYFFATNLARPWSPFNLVDVYVNAADADMPFEERIPRLRFAKPRKLSRESFDRAHVVLHPGASQGDKQWPVESFRSLAQSLLKLNSMVTLIGGRGDYALGANFPEHTNLSNRIGQTQFHELVTLLSETDVLVSADSGPVHVAASIGTTVVAIEGGGAHGWETAPYGLGHWVLQPHLDNLLSRRPDKKAASSSASKISPNAVLSVLKTHFGMNEQPVATAQCTAYESSTDGKNLLLEPKAGRDPEIEKWYADLRRVWDLTLNDSAPRMSFGHVNQFAEQAATCASIAREIAQTSPREHSSLVKLAESLKKAQVRLIGALNRFPPLHPFIRYLDISLASVEGESIHEQGSATAQVLDEIGRGLNALVQQDGTANTIHDYTKKLGHSCESI